MKKPDLEKQHLPTDEGLLTQTFRYLLWGIKTPAEYSKKRTHSIKSVMSEEGAEFLWKNPVTAGLLPQGEDSLIFIVNGHHRTREASNHAIFVIPTVIFSMEVLSEFLDKSISDLKILIDRWTLETLGAFDDRYNGSNKTYQPPQLLRGVSSVEELAEKIDQGHYLGVKKVNYKERNI